MKKLLTVLLLTLSLSAIAETRQIRVCDQYQNCRLITVYDNQPNYQNNQSNNNALINQISNSGARNFETMRQGWQPTQYPRY